MEILVFQADLSLFEREVDCVILLPFLFFFLFFGRAFRSNEKIQSHRLKCFRLIIRMMKKKVIGL